MAALRAAEGPPGDAGVVPQGPSRTRGWRGVRGPAAVGTRPPLQPPEATSAALGQGALPSWHQDGSHLRQPGSRRAGYRWLRT